MTFFEGGDAESNEEMFHNKTCQINFFNNFLFNKKQVILDTMLYEIMNNYNETIQDEITIIGNGPSLKDIDRKSLRNSILVSYNRCFIIYKNENIYPLYYFCIDKTVLINCLKNIEELIDFQ